MTRSPLLDLPGAVEAEGVDAGVAAHYGSFHHEQRTLEAGDGFVDLSHRASCAWPVPTGWAGSTRLPRSTSRGWRRGCGHRPWCSRPQGHVEHAFTGVDDGESFLAHTEPGAGAGLVAFLDSMRFMMRVEVTLVDDMSVVALPDAGFDWVPRPELPAYAEAHGPAAGLWAHEALRIARGEPRLGLDTDHRTIPNEVGWLGSAVHLDKGCYRGQETVARVHTLGRPPRRLTLLHLDGTENALPAHGSEVLADGKAVGFVGSSARHYELGPIALALLKRNTPVDVPLAVDGIAAAQEVVVDPEVGLHVRASLR